MSHYRRLSGGKRDSNEPEIIRRFAHHGWHVEQLSGTAIPDLLCWPMDPRIRLPFDRISPLSMSVLVDVKEPKGKPTPAQVEKWKALATKGIPVYVARTEADVDAIVSGAAEPWGVFEARPKRPLLPSEWVSKALREGVPKVLATIATDAGNRLHVVREPGKVQKRAPRPAYEPPRSTPPNAAREAGETFAPPPYYPVCDVDDCHNQPTRDGKCSDHA